MKLCRYEAIIKFKSGTEENKGIFVAIRDFEDLNETETHMIYTVLEELHSPGVNIIDKSIFFFKENAISKWDLNLFVNSMFKAIVKGYNYEYKYSNSYKKAKLPLSFKLIKIILEIDNDSYEQLLTYEDEQQSAFDRDLFNKREFTMSKDTIYEIKNKKFVIPFLFGQDVIMEPFKKATL